MAGWGEVLNGAAGWGKFMSANGVDRTAGEEFLAQNFLLSDQPAELLLELFSANGHFLLKFNPLLRLKACPHV